MKDIIDIAHKTAYKFCRCDDCCREHKIEKGCNRRKLNTCNAYKNAFEIARLALNIERETDDKESLTESDLFYPPSHDDFSSYLFDSWIRDLEEFG